MTPARRERLLGLQERIGHHFADIDLLDRALTHSSRAHERLAPERPASRAGHNESLEFLGDAVLGFVVADLLHRRDPEGDEGTKSRVRARIVAAPSLAQRAEDLGLPDLLLLGRGEEKTGGRNKQALWADAYEALIAAVYLDAGFDAVHRFIRDEFSREIESSDESARDHKSALQEWLQGRGEALPDYVVAAEEGPSHRRHFRVQCVVGGRVVSEGEGFSKKLAQQEAARKALEVLVAPEPRRS
jgi:ribonuclease III